MRDNYSETYRTYVLALLFTVYVVNFVDRQIVAILMESIKLEFALTDTQLGIISGLAFAIFNASVGILIGRLADRWVRRTIIALALTLWSGMTAACGFANSYFTLVLARIGVGIGEAGAGPPAHSLIADYFPPSRRATALAIYTSGINIGILIALLVGGWVNQFFGWRAAFLVVGIPGLLLAVIVRLTLKEPPRGLSENIDYQNSPEISFLQSIRHLLSIPSFRHACLGDGIFSMLLYGALNWMAVHFIRLHGMETGVLGTALALILGIAGFIGTFGAGFLSDYLVKRFNDPGWHLRLAGIVSFLSLPFFLGTFLLSNTTMALAMIIGAWLFGSAWLGPVYSVIQGVAGVRSRALAAALAHFFVNLIGLGLGPLAVGMMSDFFSTDYGDESIRYAMLVLILVTGPWGAIHFFLGARTVKADMNNT
jgi:predicted MFS family arabinose efflux permease